MASAINLVTNPSFETNLNGWTFTGVTATQDTIPNVSNGTGSGSLKCVSQSGNAVGVATCSLTGLLPGMNYTFSFWVKISAAATNFSVVPSFSGNFTPSKPLRSGDSYVRRFVGFTASSTSMTVSIQTETSLSVGDTFWIDRVMANAGGLLPYFDGTYPFSAWTGTAHNSTATNTAFDSAVVGSITTDEVVIVNGLALNTLAWNISTKSGRSTVPSNRGDDLTIPGVNGRIFVPNKPIDAGLYTLSMFILGAYPDGSIPPSPAQRAVFMKNFDQILRQCYSTSAPVTIYTWHPSGAVRTSQATLTGSSNIDPAFNMGGRRAELSLAFEVLSGVWSDYLSTTVTGTPSSSWSNASLSLQALSGGTAAIDDSVITVTGPIANPTVSNVATGTSVSLAQTLAAGQTWVVDCGAWTSKVNGTSVLAATTHVGHPRFVLIDPGNLAAAPSITLFGTNTSSATNLSVTARRKHLVS